MKKSRLNDVTQEEWDSMYQNQLELEIQPIVQDKVSHHMYIHHEPVSESSIDEIPKKTLH
jgi:hypothetical protein